MLDAYTEIAFIARVEMQQGAQSRLGGVENAINWTNLFRNKFMATVAKKKLFLSLHVGFTVRGENSKRYFTKGLCAQLIQVVSELNNKGLYK